MPAVVRPVRDDRDGLLTFLDQQRDVLRIAAYGLTDDEARRTPTASTYSIQSLVEHVITVERRWTATIDGREPPEPVEHTTLLEVLADYDRAITETDAVIARISDLDAPVPVPATAKRWAPPDVDAWSARWILLHLIQETARHAGHADIIRESIDGARAFPLMAASEGWPPRRTIQPWRRGQST